MPESFGSPRIALSTLFVSTALSALLLACGSETPITATPAAGTAAPPVGTGTNPVAEAAGTSGATSGAAGSAPTTGTTGSPAAGSGASGTGARAGASGTGGTSGGAAGTPSGAAGTTASPAAGSGGTGGATDPAAGTGGTSGATPTPTKHPVCTGGERTPCGSYMTTMGKLIEFGPYGATMDVNVGKGFEVPVAAGDSDGGAICAGFAGGFAEDPAATMRLLDTKDLNFALYSIYRPVDMKEGEKYPVITWGNGTCAMPEGYGALLRYTASHGFIVVAANSRWVGSNSPMTKALDFIEAANKDSMSPIFGRADMEKVGAMGHSQGGGATITASRDARIKYVIIWNGGTGGSKPYLAVSGDRDLGGSVSGMKSAINSASKAAFLWYHMIPGTGTASGHLTLMTQPERVVEPTVAWFKMMFNNDADSKTYFAGSSCKLCGRDAEFEFGQKGLE